jgi:hypothetical protein
VEVGKYYLVEPRDKNCVSLVCFIFDYLCSQELVSSVSLVCFTFDYMCSQELVSSYLAVLIYITKFCGY